MLSKQPFDYATNKAEGQAGEELAVQLLAPHFESIEQYSEDPFFQKRGIDLWVLGLGYVDVKTDTHQPINLFFEVVGPHNSPGGFDKSRADYYLYMFPLARLAYVLDVPETVFWLREYLPQLQLKRHVIWNQGLYERYYTEGYAVPIAGLPEYILYAELTWTEEMESTWTLLN